MKVTDFGIHLTVLGLPLTVCTLENLPRFAEPLLLDIDVDYLLTQSIRRPAPYFESQTISPWLWPTQFIERLKSLELPIDLVTIAYSVNGGYTPLGYKYFGDILKEWLVHPEESITNHPKSGSAAESYLKLTLALEREDMSTAQDLWRAMRDADPSYRTLWATAAYREETHGRWRSALDGYERMTRMDPEWEVPSLGKGRMLSRLRQWTLAEEAFQEAYRLNPSSSAATYGLGACALRRGSYEVAHRLWKTSVLQNPKMAISWYALADLETQRGNYRSALEYAQKYLSLGWSNPRVHWLMAWGAWRLGRRRMAQREFILWVQQLFRVIKMRAISLLRKIFRARRANAGGVSEVCSPTDPQLV